MSDVPRVARSVDDLQAGQVVLVRDLFEEWDTTPAPYRINEMDADALRGGLGEFYIVILADAPDPPARDWLVPATQMEALREATEDPRWLPGATIDAARAVLDAAREVEHE